ncbi:MAG: hydrogenase maturation nickel metallochaperone HypA [Candidatus Marinimicrobia bacterium]|nr:hydrogenase maturation nickel metallochaperone HypA [Candidatus Neomarinimicrobiota bacterium]
MSIAQNIINLAENAAREAQAQSIHCIDIQIGEFAGVMIEALEFALQVAVRHTLAEQAQLSIHIVPGQAVCEDCGLEFPLSQRWALCPHCESMRYTILAGDELKIKSIQVDTLSESEGVQHV